MSGCFSTRAVRKKKKKKNALRPPLRNLLSRLQSCTRTWRIVCPSSTWMCWRTLHPWITPAHTGRSSFSRFQSTLRIMGYRVLSVYSLLLNVRVVLGCASLVLRWSLLVPTTPTTLSRGRSMKTLRPETWVASTPERQWWYHSLLLFVVDSYLGVMISKTQMGLQLYHWCFRPVAMEARIF